MCQKCDYMMDLVMVGWMDGVDPQVLNFVGYWFNHLRSLSVQGYDPSLSIIFGQLEVSTWTVQVTEALHYF